jgi:predicted dehydrogenase
MAFLMKKSDASVRLGIIGLGNMGAPHARAVLDGKVPGCTLAAVADVVPEAAAKFPGIPFFAEPLELISSGKVDAILIATPHYSHTPLGVAALKVGLHVVVEKPLSVHKADCEKLIAAHTNKKLVFAAMFNQRTDPYYLKLRELIRSGELGTLRRVQWTITDWFRTEAYYASGGWRATWGGEGGGVLLNQCPHNLDLWQWLFGMPKSLRAWCAYGRYHDIEVEDDVTAYLEYEGGMTGVLIASTGEAPGTNRLEVAGERGKLVYENNRLRYTRNEVPMTEFSRTTDQGFSRPAVWEIELPLDNHGDQHLGILRNFTNAILKGEKLIAPAAEGIYSVELANAMLFSSAKGKPIDLPLSSTAYAKWLQGMVAGSRYKNGKGKKTRKASGDFSKSFANGR